MSRRGTMILLLAVLGLFGCPVFSVVAWLWGRRELRRIQVGGGDPVEEGRIRAGMIIGIVALVQAVVVGGLMVAAAAVAYRALLEFLTNLPQPLH